MDILHGSQVRFDMGRLLCAFKHIFQEVCFPELLVDEHGLQWLKPYARWKPFALLGVVGRLLDPRLVHTHLTRRYC